MRARPIARPVPSCGRPTARCTPPWSGAGSGDTAASTASRKGFQQLVDFAGSQGQDTYQPFGALVQTPDGFLLGTGYDGGLHSGGTVYALIPIP